MQGKIFDPWQHLTAKTQMDVGTQLCCLQTSQHLINLTLTFASDAVVKKDRPALFSPSSINLCAGTLPTMQASFCAQEISNEKLTQDFSRISSLIHKKYSCQLLM